MASLAPITLVELDDALAELAEQGPAAAVDRSASARLLRAAHEALVRATGASAEMPQDSLRAAARLAGALHEGACDSLSPRPRTVFRLLAADVLPAAWALLAENATGVVDDAFHDSTATGAPRTSWRLPVVTCIEPPAVYAELPGFRDPRFAAPDDCYDIANLVRLKAGVDEITYDGSSVLLAGWAALDVLATGAGETVHLLASDKRTTVRSTCRRARRPDLVSGRGEGLTRRAWAGWCGTLDVSPDGLGAGEWSLSVEVDHEGIVRSAPAGRELGALARAATSAATVIDGRTLSWRGDGAKWRLSIAPP